MHTLIKSILNATWKVGLGLTGIAAVVVGCLIANLWYEITYGRDARNDTTLSENVRVNAYSDNTVRVWNQKDARYTTPKLSWVAAALEHDSLTVFCDKEEKYGYLDINTGEIVIPARYKKAWPFSEGLGAVLGDDNCLGFIDKDNRLVVRYEISCDSRFDYVFKDGCCIVKSWEDGRLLHTVYGRDGHQLLPGVYTRLDGADRNGYRVAVNEGGAWLYDRCFNKVFPAPYDAIELAKGGVGVYVTKNHVKQLLAFDGSVIEPFVIDKTTRLKYLIKCRDNEEGEYELIPETIVYQVNDREGLMDARTGNILTPAKYCHIEMASKDLVKAELSDNGECVMMDKRGHIVKPRVD